MRLVQSERLVWGGGRYLADLIDADTLRCAFVRSPIAHGILQVPDLTAAAAADGVVAAYTATDLGLREIPGRTWAGMDAVAMTRPPLAKERVRYVGEPVAVIVAETEAAAADAVDAVDLELEPLPVVADASVALTGRVLLFPAAGTNVVGRSKVTSASPADPGTVSVAVEVESSRLAPLSIEPLGIIVRPLGRGIEIWCGHQAPNRLRRELALLLDMPEDLIRVRVPDVGGAFGGKGSLYPEYQVVSAVALRLGRGVAWVQRRREHLLGGTHGRGQHHRVELEGDVEGRMSRLRVEITADVGAYPHTGSLVPLLSQFVASGLYDIEDVEVETTVVVTNRAPTGPYRGAGRPEAALAIERAVDAFALAAGMDAAEVRRRNMIRPEALPYRTATGAVYDSGDYGQALEAALRLADEPSVREDQQRRRQAGENPIGLGIGAFVERAGGAVDSGEYGRVALVGDGLVEVRTGSVSAGQGHETVLRRLAADILTVDLNLVRVVAGDTDDVPQGIGTFASRSTQLGASAVWISAVRVREKAREIAAELLEAHPADVELESGTFAIKGVPDSGVSLSRVVAEARLHDVELAAEEFFAPGAQTFPYGVHVAVVEVEIETGWVRLLRAVTVDDCGNVIDAGLVEGQLHGSLMQGLGQALMEEIRYDGQGQPLTSTLMDYLIPTSTTELPLLTGRLVHPAPSNPLGAKGTGEAGCIGLPAAVLNAAHDALRPYGVDALQLPLTPVKVWEAIRAASGGNQRSRNSSSTGMRTAGSWR